MKRKGLFLLLCLLPVVLFGCSSNTPEPVVEQPTAVQEPTAAQVEPVPTKEVEVVELVYQNWTQDGEMPFETEFIDEFEATYPNIRIKLSVGPYDAHHDKILVSTLAGSPSDIFEIIPENLSGFVKQNAALNLDEYIAQEGGDAFSSQYFDSAWGMNIVKMGGEEHVYGLPWRYGASAMFLNVSMFEQAGVAIPDEDWTWEEFLEVARQLTDADAGKYGFAYSGSKDSFGTSWEWLCHAFANGMDGLVVDGKPQINSASAVESLEWWANLLTVEKVVPPETATLNETAIVDMLGRGQVAMWNNGPWYINNFQNSYPDLEFVTLPMPTGIRDGSSAGGTLLAVSPLSEHPDEAWEFIKFMTSKDILSEWSDRGNFMATRVDVLEGDRYQEPPLLAFSQAALMEHSYVLGAYPEPNSLLTTLHTHMQEVFLGQKSAQEALDETAAEWETIIASFEE